MKTKIIIALSLVISSIIAQNKPSVAVLNIDSKGISNTSEEIGNLVRLELEKTNTLSVLDKYEVGEVAITQSVNLNECYSKSCLIKMGKLLNVQKMISGSVERLGEKIIISIRLLNVETGEIEKTQSDEYLNLPEIQKMIEISVKKLVGVEPDAVNVSLLMDYDVPIESPKNTLSLNGPRLGFSSVLGEAGEILVNPDKEKGGFDMYPVSFQFGWQQEFQYISSGNFQALVENFVMVGGLESGRFIPSYTPLLGFRFGKGAWEFGFGPTFRLVKKAKGFYDTESYMSVDENKKGNWYLQEDWNNRDSLTQTYYTSKSTEAYKNPYSITERLDSRGRIQLDASLLIAVGKTFRSGYLNIPVNIYIAPRKNGTTVGVNVGFNIQKKKTALH